MGQYENSLGIDRPVISRVVTEDQRAVQRGQEPDGVILQREGMSIAQSIAAEGAIYQSGVPWWIPPGDGGSNGLSFTATNGKFTLSAESPMASAFSVLASGGYCYLPAGAGGLATSGWYWCYMIDGTNGEVFSETYSGTGQPAFVSSPTSLPNLSAGRITQVTTEAYGPSFTMPGGSMGPNGYASFIMKLITSSTAGTKTIRCRAGSSSFFNTGFTSNYNDQLVRVTRCNMGVQNRQIGNRIGSATGAWDSGSSATTHSGDTTTLDTSVDQTVVFTGQIAVNTDSMIIIPMQFTVQYGG
jgi:hypothetical protein